MSDGLQRPLDAPVIRIGAPQANSNSVLTDLQRRVEILERYVANLQRGRVVPL